MLRDRLGQRMGLTFKEKIAKAVETVHRIMTPDAPKPIVKKAPLQQVHLTRLADQMLEDAGESNPTYAEDRSFIHACTKKLKGGAGLTQTENSRIIAFIERDY